MRIFRRTLLSMLAMISVLIAAAPFYAHGLEQQQPDAQQPAQQVEDPIRQLNLSPEQREQIRGIREQLKEERAAINQRLRETNRVLEEALDADKPDEAVVEQRLRDVAAAQAASMRMRVLSEVRIRRLLTREQLDTLRVLRLNAKEMKRQRQLENMGGRNREAIERQRSLPGRRNGLGPFLPRARDAQPKVRP